VQERTVGWPENELTPMSPTHPKSVTETENCDVIKINIGASTTGVTPMIQRSTLGLQIPSPDPVSDPLKEAGTMVPNQGVYWTNRVKSMGLEKNPPLTLTEIVG
jgi:hypothetical protein